MQWKTSFPNAITQALHCSVEMRIIFYLVTLMEITPMEQLTQTYNIQCLPQRYSTWLRAPKFCQQPKQSPNSTTVASYRSPTK